MAKFIKRIRKNVKKDISNVVVVGVNENHIDDIVNGFGTTFCIDFVRQLPRHKNLIPLKDIGFLNDLHNIDLIFINQGYDNNVLQFIPMLVKKCAPVIFLNENVVLSIEYIDLFKRIRYEQVDNLEGYQLWKIIKK